MDPYDTQDQPSLYLGFATWHAAHQAAREARGLLVAAMVCERND